MRALPVALLALLALCTTACALDEPRPAPPPVQAIDPDDHRLPFGDRCAANDECLSDLCIDRCTMRCDDQLCPLGSNCEPLIGGGRVCVDDAMRRATRPERAPEPEPDAPDGAAMGEHCVRVSDCASGVCSGHCTQFCGDATCPDGWECIARSGYNDICRLVERNRSSGEPCTLDGQCASNACAGTCVTPCSREGVCPDGEICVDTPRPVCRRPEDLGEFGTECVHAADCVSLLCVEGMCSRRCDGAEPCTGETSCVSTDAHGVVCAPDPTGSR